MIFFSCKGNKTILITDEYIQRHHKKRLQNQVRMPFEKSFALIKENFP